ncbi:MAG: hypothetical protein AABW79_02160 [Nanoarchaeota archaeon]
MAKLTAWLMTLIGILWLLPLMGMTQFGTLTNGPISWLVGLAFLVIGISKLMRNYSSQRRR